MPAQKVYIKAGILLVFMLAWLMNCNAVVIARDNLQVCVSIAPQEYIVKKIGGDLVTVEVMVAPGASPAIYEPKPGQMRHLVQSHIYFAIGVQFENHWLETFSRYNPELQIVATQEGIEQIALEHDHKHDKADEGAASKRHKAVDPHIWLSPPLVVVQARNIHRALVKADPQNRARYDFNLRVFLVEIKAIDTDIRNLLGSQFGGEFMVFHPSWGHFARAYGLQQIAVEAGGKNPGPKKLKSLVDYAVAKNIKAIFVQPQIASKYAYVIASAIGGKVIIADPLALDWENNLRQVAAQLKNVLR